MLSVGTDAGAGTGAGTDGGSGAGSGAGTGAGTDGTSAGGSPVDSTGEATSEPSPSVTPTPSPSPTTPVPAPTSAPAPKPVAPLVASTTVADAGVTVSWVATIETPYGFSVKRATSVGTYLTLAKVSADVSSFRDVSVVPGQTSTYVVTALDSRGASAVTSAPVSAVAQHLLPSTSHRYATCPAATVTVSTASALKSAISAATSGTVIRLNPGTYVGTFSLYKSGTKSAPIWICGPRTAILTSGGYESGNVLNVSGQHDVVFAGFTVRNSFKGVTVINSDRVVVTDLLVEDIGYEAVHLRNQTSDSDVTYNTIRRAGLVLPQYGEGVYIGTSSNNWCRYNGCLPDTTSRVRVIGNTISETGAQSIEVKSGTSWGVVAGNNLTGKAPGQSGYDWVLVKGNDWVVADNVGRNSPGYGYATNASESGWAMRNVFARNSATNTAKWGVWIHLPYGAGPLGNQVSCLGDYTYTGSGTTNVTCAK